MNEANPPPSGSAAASALGNGPWPVLDMQERRILGVLVEKAKTTPDAYPMSVNGLVTGANQKSNRDPLLNLSELDVEDVLVPLPEEGSGHQDHRRPGDSLAAQPVRGVARR